MHPTGRLPIAKKNALPVRSLDQKDAFVLVTAPAEVRTPLSSLCQIRGLLVYRLMSLCQDKIQRLCYTAPHELLS